MVLRVSIWEWSELKRDEIKEHKSILWRSARDRQKTEQTHFDAIEAESQADENMRDQDVQLGERLNSLTLVLSHSRSLSSIWILSVAHTHLETTSYFFFYVCVARHRSFGLPVKCFRFFVQFIMIWPKGAYTLHKIDSVFCSYSGVYLYFSLFIVCGRQIISTTSYRTRGSEQALCTRALILIESKKKNERNNEQEHNLFCANGRRTKAYIKPIGV